MFAYIPARGGSKRIPRKNVKLLDGKPLLTHVLDTLAKVQGLSGIGVSSEDPEILALAKEHPAATTLSPRDAALADDHTDFMRLVREDAPRFADAFSDHSLLFTTATAALVPATSFQEALSLHSKNPNGLILSVTEYEQSPMLALTGTPGESLTPLFPDMYTKPTKDLPNTCVDAGCFYALSLDALGNAQRFLDLTPIQGVVLSKNIGIDLDNPSDWERLEKAYAEKH